ncbi:MAG: hypothetical protein K8F90_00565 [Hyphomicrobiales bacterium]|nr:hypothetical protein [Hyphomicrobiales bacterium]
MFFLAVSFAAVAIPYGFERFYFKKSFGPFAILFWLLVFQWSVLFGGELILENEFGQSLPSWVKAIGSAIGFLSYMTIAMTPLVAVLAAIIALIVIATEWHRKKSGKSSD